MSRLTLRSVVEISPIAPPAARTAREISGTISSPVDAPGSTTTSFSFRGAAADEPCDAAEPPLRAFFGELPLELARADYESRLANWEKWQPVAVLAQG